MAPKYPYEVEEIPDDIDMIPAELKIFENPASDWDPKVTPELLREALIDHCKISDGQYKKLQTANS